jgi:hypothetical protein
MTLRHDIDESVLALVRRADPLTTDHGDPADEEAALRAVTERIDVLETGQNRNDREPGQAGRLRPRVLAGSTLGLAGVGAAVVLALGTSATPPAYAITKHSDGSVLVQLGHQQDIGQVNQKLTEMGTREQLTFYTRPGPAAASGPINCTPGPGAGPPNPPVQVLLGTDGSTSGQSSGNSGQGSTYHLICLVGAHGYGVYTGDTGDR